MKNFFRLELHIPLLSYAIKLHKKLGISDDVAGFLTANRNGGNLITWLGTCKCEGETENNISLFKTILVKQPTTRSLAYRLQAMRSSSIFESFLQFLNEDQVRLLEAALQSHDQAKLAGETLGAESQVASFEKNAIPEESVDDEKHLDEFPLLLTQDSEGRSKLAMLSSKELDTAKRSKLFLKIRK
ncbi:hypothetical protein Plhal304r1_c017g0061961 [Plasmopara halstedii]